MDPTSNVNQVATPDAGSSLELELEDAGVSR